MLQYAPVKAKRCSLPEGGKPVTVPDVLNFLEQRALNQVPDEGEPTESGKCGIAALAYPEALERVHAATGLFSHMCAMWAVVT